MEPNRPAGPSVSPLSPNQGGVAMPTKAGAPPQPVPNPRPPGSVAAPSPVNKILHNRPGLGSPIGTATAPQSDEAQAMPMAQSAAALGGPGKITMFGKERRHEEHWSRTPNTTGSGAIHVKTFHCKLTEDALTYMDQAINEWLDAHPQYEVKFVSSSIGVLMGKLKEPALVCQVWV